MFLLNNFTLKKKSKKFYEKIKEDKIELGCQYENFKDELIISPDLDLRLLE